MEKTLFVSGAVTKSSAYNASRPDLGDLENVGTLRWIDDKIYRWVQNRNDAALAVNDVVFHTFSDGEDSLKYVRDGATADLAYMAGIVASTSIAIGTSGNSYADGGYGWIQIYGYNAAAKVLPDTNSTPAAGATLFGLDGTLYVDGENDIAMNTPPNHSRTLLLLEAVTMDTTSTVTTAKVFVCCFE